MTIASLPALTTDQISSIPVNMACAIGITAIIGTGQTGTITGDVQFNSQIRFLRGPWVFDPQGSNVNVALIGPPQITANTNDYNPAGFDTCIVLAVTTDASRNLTGLNANRLQRRLVLLINRGSFDLVVQHNNAGSAALNRFSCPNALDLTLGSGEGAWIFYDPGTGIWRVIGYA